MALLPLSRPFYCTPAFVPHAFRAEPLNLCALRVRLASYRAEPKCYLYTQQYVGIYYQYTYIYICICIYACTYICDTIIRKNALGLTVH